MAAQKLKLRTPVGELNWVKVTGEGKLKMDAAGDKPEDFIYTASVIISDEYADRLQNTLNEFWRKVKPNGIGKQSYSLIKDEKDYTLDENGDKQYDEDGDVITHLTGRKFLVAKTNVVWPDGKPNSIKINDFARNIIDLEQTGEIGNGSTGVIAGVVGAQFNPSNPGLMFFLQGIQLKTLVPYTGSEVEMEDTGEALVIESAVKPTDKEEDGVVYDEDGEAMPF